MAYLSKAQIDDIELELERKIKTLTLDRPIATGRFFVLRYR